MYEVGFSCPLNIFENAVQLVGFIYIGGLSAPASSA